MSAARRWTRSAAAACCWWAVAGTAVSACPVCFQFEDRAVSAGAEAAVLVLGGVTVSVLIPCALFAARLARRSTTPRAPGPESRS